MLKYLSSVRLAVILIAALAGLSVAATLYDLPEMYQSWPFRIIAAAFFVNLLTCSVGLWPKLLRTLRRDAASLAGKEAGFKESSLDANAFFEALAKNRYKSSAPMRQPSAATFSRGRTCRSFLRRIFSMSASSSSSSVPFFRASP